MLQLEWLLSLSILWALGRQLIGDYHYDYTQINVHLGTMKVRKSPKSLWFILTMTVKTISWQCCWEISVWMDPSIAGMANENFQLQCKRLCLPLSCQVFDTVIHPSEAIWQQIGLWQWTEWNMIKGRCKTTTQTITCLCTHTHTPPPPTHTRPEWHNVKEKEPERKKKRRLELTDPLNVILSLNGLGHEHDWCHSPDRHFVSDLR